MEIGVLVNFLDYHHPSIGWSHHNLLGVFLWEIAYWATEKVDYNTVHNTKYAGEAPERSLVVAESPQQQCYGSNGNEAIHKSVGSFTMQTYLL